MMGGVMDSQKNASGAIYSPPSLPFASFPAASTVPGQVRIASDVGPAPGIELISNGTIWRPRGGRQVLAMRTLNPVTVQNLAGAVAETLGPFPGGLVRAGMQLELVHRFRDSAVGGTRAFYYRIGTGATRNAFLTITDTRSEERRVGKECRL